MEEIKIGEYIRLENGIIRKTKPFVEGTTTMFSIDRDFLDEDMEYRNFVPIEEIKKHSSNIIDLIEERRCHNFRIQIT